MKSYILITPKILTFENLKEILKKTFSCSQVTENRLTVENDNNHLFIDYDDSIKNDYDEETIKCLDGHFYSMLYESEHFAKEVISLLKDFDIKIDDDEGNIFSIKEI